MTVTLTYDPATGRTTVTRDGRHLFTATEPDGGAATRATAQLYRNLGYTVTVLGLDGTDR